MKKLIILISIYSISNNICDAQLSLVNSGNTVGSNVFKTLLADVNNDGYIDCYTIPVTVWDANWNGGTVDYIKLYLNNRDGTFSFKQNIGRVGCQYIHADFADLDNDNDIDLVVAHDGYKNEVWLNDGEGNFTKGQQFGIEPSNGIKLGDLNGDGAIDAVVSNYHYANADMHDYQPDEIWLNDGSGTFALDTTFCRSMAEATLCDIDADNDLDIIFGDSIWLNNGFAHFQKNDNELWQNSLFTFVYDFNEDNYPDVLVTRWDEPSEIWLNNGNLTFSKFITLSEATETLSACFFDVDNDGDIDILEGNSPLPDNPIPGVLWINQGDLSGAVGPFLKSETSYPNGCISIADLTNNGEPDAIFGNEIWINEYGATSFNEINHPQLQIFPNPAYQTILIKGIDKLLNKANYQLTDLNGKTILHGKLNIETIDISGLPKGVYMLRLNTCEGIITEKIVIE